MGSRFGQSAIELAIKAYLVLRGEGLNPKHDLVALYDKAVEVGLKRNSRVVGADLQHLSKLHKDAYARYPQAPVRPVGIISQFDDLANELIEDVERSLGKNRP